VAETTQVAEPAAAGSPARDAPASPSVAGAPRTGLLGIRVAEVALFLIVVQLVVRGWVASTSYLWWDDLILTGRAALHPLLSSEFLLYDHDGHFMPAGFLISGLLMKVAPMEWWPLGITLVLIQAVASLSVWRLLRVLLGDRPIMLVPLLIYLFSPLTLPTYSWWSAAINSIPLQAALAWVCADAVLLLRTGRRRYAVSGVLALALSLTFFEKSVVVPVVAFAVVAVLLRHDGETAPLVTAFRRCLPLWAGSALVLAGWYAIYSSVVASPTLEDDNTGTVASAIDMARLGVVEAFIPSALGGPLHWGAGSEWASPPTALVVGSLVVLAAAVIWTSWRRRSGMLAWWLLLAYVGVSVLAVIVGRLGASVPAGLALSLRYYADSAVILALAIALVAHAPGRPDVRARLSLRPRVRRPAALLAAACFLVLSGWSTATYVRAFQDDLPRDYIANARDDLLTEGDVPMLEQRVPDRIMWGLAHPNNRASVIFAPLERRPEFGNWTSDLRMLGEDGHVVEGRVTKTLSVFAGPVPGCGHPVRGDVTTEVALDGELFPWGWTVQLNYLASTDGVIEVGFQTGEPIRVPVEQGPGSVYFHLEGGGEHIKVTSRTSGLGVCVDTGLVGELQPVASAD
jgi:hypothetical protein